MSRTVPGVAAPSLASRLEDDPFRAAGGVSYRRLHTRSLVNRCSSPKAPFEWTANPYRGCAMGCRYCYASYTHEYVGLDATADFHSTIFAKTGGELETARALARAAARGELVALGTATDPYQPAEATLRVTRGLLEAAARLRGLRLAIVTKGALVLRDLDVLQRLHARSTLTLSVSLISLDADLLRVLEPWAPAPSARLLVLRRLIEAGLEASLSVAPVLPGLTDSAAQLDSLFAAVRAVGVTRVVCRPLFLRSPTREAFLNFLGRAFPRLLPAYERAYARHSHLRGAYPERLRRLVARLAERHGLEASERSSAAGRAARQPTQLALWETPAETRVTDDTRTRAAR
jgi:DNA repair photolyase